jgi:hypothetical protein
LTIDNLQVDSKVQIEGVRSEEGMNSVVVGKPNNDERLSECGVSGGEREMWWYDGT